jgi:hypothetical protein
MAIIELRSRISQTLPVAAYLRLGRIKRVAYLYLPSIFLDTIGASETTSNTYRFIQRYATSLPIDVYVAFVNLPTGNPLLTSRDGSVESPYPFILGLNASRTNGK